MSVFSMTRTVIRNLFSRPATRLYPARRTEPWRTERSRGRIEIDIDRCIFCSGCVRRCPTDALIVIKTRKEWNIDRLRCCACNACVEVCPVKCLRMDNRYSPVTTTRDKDIFRRAAGVEGKR
jgi:ech hydrogenase subunit F